MCGSSSPASTTQNVTTQTQLPAWYTSYLQQVMGQAENQAGQQTPPPIQQVAGLSDYQDQAIAGVAGAQGMATPYYNNAENAYTNAAGAIGSSPNFTGQAYAGGTDLNASEGLYGQVANTNTAAAAQPYVNAGTGYLSQAANTSGLAAAQPYLNAGTAPQGLAAAQPYLNAASGNWTQNASAYMSPYVTNANDALAQQQATNFQEFTLPSVQSQFVSAGQSGSPQEASYLANVQNQENQSLLEQQSQNLNTAYNTGASTYESDASRQAQLAGTAGGLGTAQQQAELGAGSTAGSLTQQQAAQQAQSGSAIGNLGLGLSSAQAQNAGLQLGAAQGLESSGLGIGQLGLGAATAQGQYNLNQASTLGQLGTSQANLGTTAQNQALTQASALEQAGALQQNQGQQNLNSLFANQQAQYNLPWTNIGNESSVIQGLPVNSTTSSAATGTQNVNGAAQVAGLGIGVAGLSQSGIFAAKGGKIKKPRRVASYGHTAKRGIDLSEAA